MPARRIGATWVFPLTSPPVKNGVIELNEEGMILSVKSLSDSHFEESSTEFHNGILVPGFVNTHIHLEFSWCRSMIPMHSGLPGFLEKIAALSSPSTEDIEKAIEVTVSSMAREGIVAAGNILNTKAGFPEKSTLPFPLHHFIELLDLPAARTNDVPKGLDLFHYLRNQKNDNGALPSVSVTPHAPYTVSERLLAQITSLAVKYKFPVSIHNQETSSENAFFRSGNGPLAETLHSMNTEKEEHFARKPSSLQAFLPLLPRENNILLVHNTFTTEEDIDFARTMHPHLFWVLCPNANLYIENALPPVNLFRRKNCTICIGTDSLASNNKISVLDELKTLSVFFPEIPLHELLLWASYNGAKALGLENYLGSIELGKKPGLVLIENADLRNLKITPKAKARRID